MTLCKTKLFVHNHKLYIDIRSYEARKAIKKDEDLIIIVGDQKMTLQPHQVAFDYNLLTPDRFKSKIGGEDYYLWSYRWKPDKPQTEEEELKELSKQGIFG